MVYNAVHTYIRLTMTLIVGLQNPGEKYKDTRHNVGSVAVRAFGTHMHFPQFVASAAYSGDVADGVVEGKDVRLLLPTTFMNNSGVAVSKAIGDSGEAHDVVVVYDDLDLPIGTFKISHSRGAGGHNGIKSVIEKLGTQDFVRVRIGIAPVSLFGKVHRPVGEQVSPFVLKKFSGREKKKVDSVLSDIVSAIETLVTKGKEEAMNIYN